MLSASSSSNAPLGRNDASAVTAVIERAPAKINLALHVVGRREDGYHELQSLVTFANVVDTVRVQPSDRDGLCVSGFYATDLPHDGVNLVEKARDVLRRYLAKIDVDAPPVTIFLEKNLPIASGIGGGSADAAATLRALVRLWNAAVTPAELHDLARSIGADVPMCLASRPLLAEGIGERLRTLAPFPTFDMVVVNPGRAVSTPEVFRRLRAPSNAALKMPRRWGQLSDAVSALSQMRNDLEGAAQEIAPEIGQAKTLLKDCGALIARMSGSGATCFGIFAGAEAARAAKDRIRRSKPGWYAADCRTFYGVAGHPEGRHGRG